MSHVNLQELALPRSPRSTEQTLRRTRHWGTRYFLPGLILTGFVSVLAWSLAGSLLPAKTVTVIPVVATRSDVAVAESPLFQAAGWIEPRPQPAIVSALTEGIVDEMLVVEGQALEAGQVVARLVRRDAEIELQRAAAEVRLREAEVKTAQASLVSARVLFEKPLPLMATLAEAETLLAKVQTDLAKMPTMMRSAETKRDFAAKDVLGKSRASDAIPAIVLERVKADLKTAEAQLEEYHQQAKSLKLEEVALSKRSDVLRHQLDLKIDETRQLAESEAKVQAAEAQLQQARAVCEAAALKLERTDVRVRTAGHVLALVAKPGSRLMGINQAAVYDASTVITMYDPANLQVRADVRLDDVPHVVSGQSVRIETPAIGKPLTGHVLMATALTDIQKNTLQVKISIDDPPSIIKPDMLVQVTFLAPPRSSPEGSKSPLRLLIPQDLVQGTGEDATVWLADQINSQARLRRISLGTMTEEGLREITTGLNVGDRLIVSGRESLRDGDRIRISAPARVATKASNLESATVKSSQIPRSGN